MCWQCGHSLQRLGKWGAMRLRHLTGLERPNILAPLSKRSSTNARQIADTVPRLRPLMRLVPERPVRPANPLLVLIGEARRSVKQVAGIFSRAGQIEIGRAATTFVPALQQTSGLLSRGWKWFLARRAACSVTKRLSVAASLSLGEKRFVAVIQVDGKQFLVGGGASNVALLAQLDQQESFGNLLKESIVSAQQLSLVDRLEKLA